MGEKYYRFEYSKRSNGLDDWDEPIPRVPGTGIEVRCIELDLLKRTPKGVWVGGGMRRRKFVLNDAYKQYACASKEKAYESFLARTGKHIRILKGNLLDVETAVAAAKRMMDSNVDRFTVDNQFDLKKPVPVPTSLQMMLRD